MRKAGLAVGEGESPANRALQTPSQHCGRFTVCVISTLPIYTG